MMMATGHQPTRVMSYSTKISPNFHDSVGGRTITTHRDRGEQPMTGIELEMEYCNGEPRAIVEKLYEIFG